jgi:hypothetical protein
MVNVLETTFPGLANECIGRHQLPTLFSRRAS